MATTYVLLSALLPDKSTLCGVFRSISVVLNDSCSMIMCCFGAMTCTFSVLLFYFPTIIFLTSLWNFQKKFLDFPTQINYGTMFVISSFNLIILLYILLALIFVLYVYIYISCEIQLFIYLYSILK